ncbi:MAG: glycoside hydrolase family 25 protein [Lachnospiraceae bacterium]|nr:glycoside hydrolase family 25 protein [Lachnospiraceae bacterium]
MKKGKNIIFTIAIIILGLISILSVSGCLILIISNARLKQEADNQPVISEIDETVTYSGTEVEAFIEQAKIEGYQEGKEEIKSKIKNTCEESTSIIQTLRELYPEYVVYLTSGHYEFHEILDSVPKLSISLDNLKRNDAGFMEYTEKDKLKSEVGIDVSKYQGKIDWKKVKAAGVDYAMIRIGIRGYESGALVLDETCEDNIKGAIGAGIPVGVYFFSQAVTQEEALEEAHLVMETIAPYKITYPVAIDIEDVNKPTARTNILSVEERTVITKAFLDTIKEGGYTPMIYGNIKSFCGMLDLTMLNDYAKWFAFYDETIYFPYEIEMWQYTEKGKVDGIEGEVDLNIRFK